MANIDILVPFILKWEGGFVNDPADAGGATNKGVTIGTWRKVGYDKDGDGDIDVDDLKLLSVEDVRDRVLKPHYWDRWKADDIICQALANTLVDWVWCSGKWGIIIPQRILGVEQDGIVGVKTLNAINSFYNYEELFNKIQKSRLKFVDDIVKRDNSQKKYINGWKRRINAITFNKLNYE
jgi:lysozyme family protein